MKKYPLLERVQLPADLRRLGRGDLPALAVQLRDRKLSNLQPLQPETIVSANIGCIQHLQTGTSTPVRHWVEVLDDALAA